MIALDHIQAQKIPVQLGGPIRSAPFLDSLRANSYYFDQPPLILVTALEAEAAGDDGPCLVDTGMHAPTWFISALKGLWSAQSISTSSSFQKGATAGAKRGCLRTLIKI